MTRKRLMLASLALLVLRLAAAAEADRPYVVRNAQGRLEAWSVVIAPEGARRQVSPTAPGSNLVVPAVGSLPAFEVSLREPVAVAPDSVRGSGAKQPLFLVADTHGEYEILA